MRLFLKGELVPTNGQATTDMVIPLNWRSHVLSLLKLGLSNTDEQLYNYLYNEKPVQKDFTYAVKFDDPQVVEADDLSVAGMKVASGLFELTLSVPDLVMGLKFHNALLWVMNNTPQKFAKDIVLAVTKVVQLEEKKVTAGSAIVKFHSPLVVNDHDQATKHSHYMSLNGEDDNRLLEVLMDNTKRQLAQVGYTTKELESLAFVPLDMHKVVAYAFDKYFESSMGTMQIKGDPKIVNHILVGGLGSNRGLGFGSMVLMEQL